MGEENLIAVLMSVTLAGFVMTPPKMAKSLILSLESFTSCE